MKNVTASTEDLISRLESELGVEMEENITPEQAIMHWINFHLKKGGCARIIKNFTKDICDSEVYAQLLRRIAPNQFLKGEYEFTSLLLLTAHISCHLARNWLY
jgi:hypothetical protein